MIIGRMPPDKPGPHWIGQRPHPPVLSHGAMLHRAATPRPRPFSNHWRLRLIATLAADPALLAEILQQLEASQ